MNIRIGQTVNWDKIDVTASLVKIGKRYVQIEFWKYNLILRKQIAVKRWVKLETITEAFEDLKKDATGGKQ